MRSLGGFTEYVRGLSFSFPDIRIATPSSASISKSLMLVCSPNRIIAAALPQPWQQSAITEQSGMAAPDRFIAWCKQEQASIEQQPELLQAGKVRTGEDIGSG